MAYNKEGFTIRYAEEKDAATVLSFIRELAVFEKMEEEMTATLPDIQSSLFQKKQAQVLLAESGGLPAGFAVFFYSYSTLLGGANIYLEDLFVKKEFRGRGLGRALLRRLAQIAAEQGCRRLDWLCHDWNTPAAAFYSSIGAYAINDRRMYRIDGKQLAEFAGKHLL